MIPALLIVGSYLIAIYLERRRRKRDFDAVYPEIPQPPNIVEQLLREFDPVRAYWVGVGPPIRLFTFGVAFCKNRLRRVGPVVTPPGTFLLRVAIWVYRPRTVARVFEPIVSDMQVEQVCALKEGRRWKAHWVVLRGYWDFVRAMGLQGVVSWARQIFEFWKISGGS